MSFFFFSLAGFLFLKGRRLPYKRENLKMLVFYRRHTIRQFPRSLQRATEHQSVLHRRCQESCTTITRDERVCSPFVASRSLSYVFRWQRDILRASAGPMPFLVSLFCSAFWFSCCTRRVLAVFLGGFVCIFSLLRQLARLNTLTRYDYFSLAHFLFPRVGYHRHDSLPPGLFWGQRDFHTEWW